MGAEEVFKEHPFPWRAEGAAIHDNHGRRLGEMRTDELAAAIVETVNLSQIGWNPAPSPMGAPRGDDPGGH